MACEGGVGTCAYDPCGQFACLNEAGYCSDTCQEDDQRQEVAGVDPVDLRPWRPDVDDATPADPT